MTTTTASASDFRMPLSLARIAATKPATYRIEARRATGSAAAFPVDVNAHQEAELPSNWEFRFVIDAPSGYVYLFHPSRCSRKGERSWVMLPPSTPRFDRNRQQARTGWLGFDGEPGVERLYLIWSERPIAGLPQSRRLEPVPVDRPSEVPGLLRGTVHTIITLKPL